MIEHVVIVGGGRVGRHVAELLGEEQYTVSIIEQDPERCERLPARLGQVVEGDGTDPDVFARTDPAEATVVAALTNDTEVNLAVCEMARELAPEARTILRVAEDGEQALGYRNFVDDVVYPAAAGASATVDRINRI